jgi:hypothetical protein
MMTMRDFQDGRRGNVGAVVPLKIQTGSRGTVTALFQIRGIKEMISGGMRYLIRLGLRG